MSSYAPYLKPVIEKAIKKQIGLRLSMLAGGGPITSVLTWVVMKYAVTPALEESIETIEWQVEKYKSKKRLEKVNEAKTDSTFTDAFEHI